MGVYAIVLYQKLKPTNSADVDGSSGKCRADTTLKLLLALGCLELVTSFFFLLGVCGQCISIFRACIGESDKAGSRIEGAKGASTGLVGLAIFGISVAISVFVWAHQCKALNADQDHNYYYQFLHVYLILHWTLPFAVGLLGCCLSCILGICAGGAAEASKDYVAITPDD
jgi:hypothetical protein